MAYIGKEPIVGNFQKCDALTASATADYTLQVGSSNVSPESVNHMIVSLNGVIQSPTTAYTVSGSTLSFASALTTSDTIDFVILLGNVLDIGTPSDDTVGAAQIKDDLISGTTALASEPDDTDEFLVSDAGTLKRLDYSLIKGGGITAASQWKLTTGFTGDAVITSNLIEVDTAGYGGLGSSVTESSGVFTFPSTGFYFVLAQWQFYTDTGGNSRYNNGYISYTANNGGAWTQGVANCTQQLSDDGASAWLGNASCSYLFDITDTTNQKVRFETWFDDDGVTCHGGVGGNETHFSFIRLGDT